MVKILNLLPIEKKITINFLEPFVLDNPEDLSALEQDYLSVRSGQQTAVSNALSKLSLKTFRCFASQCWEFKPGINLITGPNGAGKSSLLEAVYYLSYGKSFRGAAKEQLFNIDQGNKQLYISLNLENKQENQSQILSLGLDSLTKIMRLDQVALTSHRQIGQYLLCQLLQQEHLEIILGYPETRRQFLQQCLYLYDFNQEELFKKLRKVLDQRKALLLNRANSNALLPWTQQLWFLTCQLQAIYRTLLPKLEETINLFIQKLGIAELLPSLKLRYSAKVACCQENTFLEWQNLPEQKRLWQEEQLRQQNLFGPQMDDLEIITQQGVAWKNYASRGQQKFGVLLLKAASLRLAKTNNPSTVRLFLIDDFFSELAPDLLIKAFELLNILGYQSLVATPVIPDFMKTIKPKS